MNIIDFMNLNTFTDFKNQKKIKIENEKEINSFFNIAYNDKFKPFYHLSPLYNTILNCNQFQYIVINFNNDDVFICYKLIQIMKLKQVRIIGQPISKQNNNDNVLKVEKKLKSLNFIRLVYVENDDPEFKPLIEYNDYYYDFKKHNFNSKYRSKCGINKMLSNKDFEVIVTHYTNKDFINKLRDSWVYSMKNAGNNVSNKNTKDFYKIVTYNNDNNINIILTYKGEPISIQNFIINNSLHYADCLYINHLGRNTSNDIDLNRVLKNMTKIQNYLAYSVLNELGINMVYIAGCRPTEKRLLKHKARITDGVLKYYIR